MSLATQTKIINWIMKFVSLLATLMLVHTLADAAASLDGENNTGGDASASASNAIIKTWEGLESRITLLPPAGAKKEVAITLTVGSPFSMAGYNGSAITIPKGYHVSIAAAPPGGDGSAIPRSITSGGGTRVVLDAGSKGTLFIAEGALLVDSVTLKNGIALTGNGGVLTVNPNGTAAFAGCSFVNNTAPAGDGGVAHVHSYGSATFTSCSFVKNSASAGGGAVDVYLGSARFVNCKHYSLI